MTSTPFPSANFPASAYPIVLLFVREDTGAVIHEVNVPSPGAVVVPPLYEKYGSIAVCMVFADGHVVAIGSDGEEIKL